ncbi:MAG TPA: hypothetical protein VNA11_00760, partial [Pseudonocardia sp.]|nr:hypothetical protein [Pseudonocardia sp.]
MAPDGRGLSLLTGWLPITLQVVAALALLAVLARRAGRRWYLGWVPIAGVVGIGAAVLVRHQIGADGLTNDPVPDAVWIWTAVTAAAAVLAAVGWPNAGWWRRAMSLLAVPLALLCVGSTLNRWVGYFPT